MPILSVLNEEKDHILSLSFLRSHLDLDELKSYGLLRPGWINEWSFTFCDLSLVCVLLCPHSLKWVCVTSTSFSIRDAPLFLLSLKMITLVLISFEFSWLWNLEPNQQYISKWEWAVLFSVYSLFRRLFRLGLPEVHPCLGLWKKEKARLGLGFVLAQKQRILGKHKLKLEATKKSCIKPFRSTNLNQTLWWSYLD